MSIWNEDVVWNQADQSHEDPVLGTMWWLFERGEWTGSKEIASGLTVTMAVGTDEDRSCGGFDPTYYLADSRVIWKVVTRRYEAIHAAATTYCIRQYNEIRESATELLYLEGAEVAAKLLPYHVDIYTMSRRDKSATVRFEDGDILGSHSLDVDVSPDGEPLDVSMNG